MAKKKGRIWADHYTEKAKKENYPARSVYKLKEIDEKYRLIKGKNQILDLGCSPGSWLLYAAQKAGVKSSIKGIDLNPITIALPPQVKTYVGNIFSLTDEMWEEIGGSFDLILSDMAPTTSGNKWLDAVKSFDLCMKALSTVSERLKKNGHFVCKIFEGEDVNTFAKEVQAQFEKMKRFKPKSSRRESKEIFIIGMGKMAG